MFVDVVPIKWAALSWMVSSFLSVVGAAPIQVGSIPSHSGLVSCRWWIGFGESGGKLRPTVFLASDLL